jgi:phospholipid/cholesterol/gamma-HCH transport system permease protein
MQTMRGYLESWNWRAERVGEFTLHMLEGVSRFLRTGWHLAGLVLRLQWLARPAVTNVLIRQIYFTGVQSFPWVIFMALAAGVLAVYNIVVFAKQVEDLSLIGSLMNGVLVQEMAPFMVAIFLLARSGVAVVTEVGNMHVRGEDMLLRSLGVDMREYLHLPRILAFALCGLILTFMFVAIAIWVGGLAVSWNHALNFSEFVAEVRRGTSMGEVLAMVAKGMFYPMLACMVLLDQGCRVGRDPNQIPVRATNGVLGALMLMVLIDVLWVMLRG